MGGQTTADDPARYRLAAELESGKQKDPIERLKQYLIRSGMAEESFFSNVAAEADEVGTRIRKACLEMPDPDPLSMFDNIYAEPTALLAEERAHLAAYISSFISEEVGR